MTTIPPETAAVVVMLAPNPAVFRALQTANHQLHATPQQQFAVRRRYRQLQYTRPGGNCSRYLMVLSNGLQDGIVIWCHSNGSIRQRFSYVSGKLHGICQIWRRSGQLYEQGLYINGRRHGEYLGWYSSGQLNCSSVFANGKPHGMSIYWDQSGEVIARQIWINGVLVGEIAADKCKD